MLPPNTPQNLMLFNFERMTELNAHEKFSN